MTDLTPITFTDTDIDQIAGTAGRIAVLVDPDGRLDVGARRVNKLTRGALARLIEAPHFAKLKPGDAVAMAYPTGLAAEAVDVVCLPKGASVHVARRAGASLAKLRGQSDMLILAGEPGGWQRSHLVSRCGITDLMITKAKPSRAKVRCG